MAKITISTYAGTVIIATGKCPVALTTIKAETFKKI